MCNYRVKCGLCKKFFDAKNGNKKYCYKCKPSESKKREIENGNKNV